MESSATEPPPGLEQEGEVSSRSLSSSSLPSPFDSPIDQSFNSEAYVSQTAAQLVWQAQPKTDLDLQPFCLPFHDAYPYLAKLPRFNKEIHALPPSQGAPNGFHHTPSHQLHLGGVYQPSSQYFVEQPQPMVPVPSPAIPPPINVPSVGSGLAYQTNLTPRGCNTFQNAESDASNPTARVLGSTEQYVGNNLHTQHQTSPKAGSATNSTNGSLPVQRGGRESKQDQTPAVAKKFLCTFCCDSFKYKRSWSRHELSQHLDLGGWKCTPFGPLTVSTVDGTLACSYCGLGNPTVAHLKEHKSHECNKARVFPRKENLTYHLMRTHKAKPAPPWTNTWVVKMPKITSRCGFCGVRLESWDEREDHLGEHFSQGKTMRDWRGDHCFAPWIAAKVRKAIPPYMIAGYRSLK
ncbi:unnamed protein product [Clonostachys rhizophaga]|uniref:C2H2-type domain-containing protein n=1 Tax=Clonostachys rhizophaga TaxID=160324 RepID=A0A9N9YIL2_9HYPO|nr:unnamed protein product [Clonostachys rhizophaga]